MSITTRVIDRSPDEVFDVLSHGWNYSQWVVGASRIRDVTEAWPEEGSEIHHSVGAWPMLIDDVTTVVRSERPRLLELTVRAWPTGEGRVLLTLEPEGDGTLVTMEEHPTKGVVRLLPKPVVDPVLDLRNRESLARLALLVERARQSPYAR
jgi:uncharacterized protein YndB with AHSA1/START domain